MPALNASRYAMSPIPNQLACLQMALQDARSRLQSAVLQEVHEDDRATLHREVGGILDEIERLKTSDRYRLSD
jgi:hypothetical protein